MRWFHPVLLALTLICAAPAFAVQPDEILPDPALEARARAISRDLRCLVCQNQSIDDSDADLARDLRILLRERLKAGDSDQQAVDFLVARYGEFVLLRPVFAWHTAVLWFGPPFALVAGALALFAFSRRRAAPAAAEAHLTPAEEARVSQLLDQKKA